MAFNLVFNRDKDIYELQDMTSHLQLWIATILHELYVSIQPFQPFLWRKFKLQAQRVHIMGVCVEKYQPHPKCLCFLLDDSSACIRCLILKHPAVSGSDACPDKSWISNVEKVQVGRLLCVRGTLKSFRGAPEVQAVCVEWERDPNSEIRHWLECIETVRLVREATEGA